MITDTLGNELTYWPISELIEGGVSETLEFVVPIPSHASELKGAADYRYIIWAKKVGDAAFVNLGTTPYSLAGLSGNVHFQMYIEALSPIVGLERLPIPIVAGASAPAGWTA